MKTLIKNGYVITMDFKRKEVVEKLDILYNDDKICFVGKDYNGEYDEIIDATDKIVMPGLINCHTHIGMSLFRATNDSLKLDDWLHWVWPIEDKMDSDIMYNSSLLSCVEMIMSGTTCFNDMYFEHKGTMKAIMKSNIRCLMSRCVMGDIDKDGLKRISEFKELIKDYHNIDLVKFSVSPHSLYTCSENYLKEVNKLAKEYNLPIHIHFCENLEEVKTITNKYHKSPSHVLKDLGFLDHKLILAHGTFINKDDLHLFKDKDVSIVTNPLSNLNLGCGIADLILYKNNNINICLGTDGQGSGNSLNLFKTMMIVGDLQKAIYKDPTIISSLDVLKMATINGAKALGLEKEIGSIEVGKKADIIILDLNKNNNIYPYPNIINNIVHNIETINVDTTIINGKILMKNNKLLLDIDLNELKNNINSIIKKLNIN